MKISVTRWFGKICIIIIGNPKDIEYRPNIFKKAPKKAISPKGFVYLDTEQMNVPPLQPDIDDALLNWLDQPIDDTKTLFVVFEDGELGTIARIPWAEAKQALYQRLAAEAEDVEQWVGTHQGNGHGIGFKAVPLDKLKAIMEIKE